jgi:hypothetical protein
LLRGRGVIDERCFSLAVVSRHPDLFPHITPEAGRREPLAGHRIDSFPRLRGQAGEGALEDRRFRLAAAPERRGFASGSGVSIRGWERRDTDHQGSDKGKVMVAT